MTDYLILLMAAFGAGILNTIAGGGTFLTFPALVYAGIPPVAANATSAVVVFPGYAGGVLGFGREIAALDRRGLLKAAASAVLGGLAGSLLLVFSPDRIFSALVPFLLLASTLIFAYGQRIEHWLRSRSMRLRPYGFYGVFLAAAYGGYFNGGLGILLLALFALWGMTDIGSMNGLKNALSLVLSAISFVIFSLAGIVVWKQALLMMAAAVAGGYAGAPLARALPEKAIRALIVATGGIMSIIFLMRFWNPAA